MNALYDLCSRTYTDAIVQKRRNANERRALCDMVDRYISSVPTIFIADRGYESYNTLAHIQQIGMLFLFRIKDLNSRGILQGFDLPDNDVFDLPISLTLTNKQTNFTKSLCKDRKAIADSDNYNRWYEPTKYSKIKKYFEGVDWENVSSNLEKLPYYAYTLKNETVKAEIMLADDSLLFTFATEPDWKEKLDKVTLERVASLINDYETALRRIQYIKHTNADMKRKNDVYRILFARGQEKDYTVDELYSIFDNLLPSQISKARQLLNECSWQFTSKEERLTVLYSICGNASVLEYTDFLCDFRESGYRILGDIICDIDDMYRSMGIKKNISKKDDSPQLKRMLAGAFLNKEQIIKNCLSVIKPVDRKDRENALSFEDVVKYAVALNKRQFALEVLPQVVLNLALSDKPEKKRRFWK